MDRISPQLWIIMFVFGALASTAVLLLLWLYRHGGLRLSRTWGTLRMRILLWYTEHRRKRGRKKSMALEQTPYLIVGLGNPGREYRDSRHNIGFSVVDALARHFGLNFSRLESDALLVKLTLADLRLYLAKPQTYMNNSGRSVGTLSRFYKIEPQHVLVISDDLDLPLGKIRLRPGGGSGGHKGLQSIIQHLGTDQFPRLRIGIGRPANAQDPADYVLQRFREIETAELEITLAESCDCILTFLQDGIDMAMNRYNTGSADNGTE